MPRVMVPIMVPTDFSDAGLLVAEEALSSTEARGGELLLLHVVPDIFIRWADEFAVAFIDQASVESAYEDLRAEGLRKFARWLPYHTSARCRTLAVVGETTDAIIKVVRAEAIDLIVMRAPKRRRWRPSLAGGVTDTVMRRAPAPVVVWAGLDRLSLSGYWREAWQPFADEPPREDAQLAGKRERQRRVPLLKSW